MAGNPGYSMGTVAGTDIPVEHLDYGYIGKSKNARELEEIVKVLRSGKEGCYPQLLELAEKRLVELKPDSKTLLRDVPARRLSELNSAERSRVEQDLEGWMTEMGGDGPLPSTSVPGMVDVPPIRAAGVRIAPTQGKPLGQSTGSLGQGSQPGRIKSWDFSAWDKYDVEKAVEEVDQADSAKDTSPSGCQGDGPRLPGACDLSEWELSLPQAEKEQLAERERMKGNEEFRSSGFEEALRHYRRSVALHPTTAALNNRALTYLKLSSFKEAMLDCEQVLAAEPDNPKALYRKATACEHLGDLNLAKECLERALQVDSNNLKAQELLKSVEKKLQSKLGAALPGPVASDPSRRAKGKGKKIQIEEVLEGPSDSALQGPTHTDVGEREGSREEVGASDQPSASPVDVFDLQTHQQTHDKEQQLCDSDQLQSGGSDKLCSSDSDKLHFSDSDKLQSSVSDKLQFSVSDKQNSSDIDKQQPDDAEMQRSPPPDVSVLPNHLPSEVHVMKEAGNDLFQKGQYGEALEKYSQALQSLEKASSPGSVGGRCMLLNNRAACWLKLGDCNQCVKDCSSSIELYAVNIKAFARRAQAFELKEKFGLAYADYKCAVMLDSLFEQGRKAMARLSQFLREQYGEQWMDRLPQGDSELVQRALSTGCARDMVPVKSLEDFDVLREEGNSLVRSGQFLEALECYSRCIAVCPENAVGYTNRALCHLKLNQPSLAEQDCSTALLLEPANIKALYRRGLARKEQRKFSEAARDLSDLLKRDQGNMVATKELESVKTLWRKELKDLQSDVRSAGRIAQPPAGGGKRKKKIVVEEASEEAGEDGPVVTVPLHPLSAQYEPEDPKRLLKGQMNLEDPDYRLSAAMGKVSPFEFLQKWNSVPSRAGHAAGCYALLLSQVDPPELPRLISKSLDGAMLSGILKALQQPIILQDMPRVLQLLQSLTSVARFSTIVLFLSEQEKQDLREVFHQMRVYFSNLPTQATLDTRMLEEQFGLL